MLYTFTYVYLFDPFSPTLKFPFLILGIETRASHILGMCSTYEVKFQNSHSFIWLVTTGLFIEAGLQVAQAPSFIM